MSFNICFAHGNINMLDNEFVLTVDIALNFFLKLGFGTQKHKKKYYQRYKNSLVYYYVNVK